MKLEELFEKEEVIIENKESRIVYSPKIENNKIFIPLKNEYRNITNQPIELIR